MSFPLVLAVCEDDLERDLTFLKEIAGPNVDIQIAPRHGLTLDGNTARSLAARAKNAKNQGFDVRALLVHRDADKGSVAGVRREIEGWAKQHHLSGLARLICCVPAPCTERWLCLAAGMGKPAHASPAAGCDPWKKHWGRKRGIDLDRVRDAANEASARLTGQEDFDCFWDDWRAAGLA
jgi:hypothetical protein